MNSNRHEHSIWMLLLCILPILLFLLLAWMGVGFHPALIWIVLIVCCIAMFYLMAGASHGEHAPPTAPPPPPQPEPPSQATLAQVSEVFHATREQKTGDAIVLEGQLHTDADHAYDILKERFADSENMPLLQEDEAGRPSVILAPRNMFTPRGRNRSPWLNLVLFVATIATTTWAGALHQGVSLLEQPSQFALGLPYSLALILILGAHELGHYFTARAHGMHVTLPFFIPIPFALGTFGAFIQLKSPAETRRALFDMAVAGPLAGLVFAVPALYFGLQLSEIVAAAEGADMMHAGANVGSSALLAAVAKVAIGEELLTGHVLQLHPLAFAGWLGLIVTALNLLPIGQLDGGHMADAMFGPRVSGSVSMLSIFALFLLGLFVWSGLLVWAFIVYFIAGRKGMPPLNNVSRLTPGRQAVGWFAYAILVAILLPVPHAFFEQLGIHCPYL